MSEETRMRRFRFYVPGEDPRPIGWPPQGPFWCTGYEMGGTYSVVVAFLPDLATLLSPDHWPDAFEINDQGEMDIIFSDRFPKPDWWSAPDD